jgi:hypothetical protein
VATKGPFLSTIPETIGRYRILERVGAGGDGVLSRGIDAVLDRDVAIKLMLTDFAPAGGHGSPPRSPLEF